MDLSTPGIVRPESEPAPAARTDAEALAAADLDALADHAGVPGGSATQHLCAAAHLDRNFRQQAIRELVENKYRKPAASPGIDLARVLAECLRVRRDAVIAGWAVILVAVIGFKVAPIGTGAALGIVLLTRALTWLVGLLYTVISSWFRSRGDSTASLLRSLRAAIVIFIAFPLLSLLVGLPIGLIVLISQNLPGGGSPVQSTPGVQDVGGSESPYTVLIVLLLWVAIGTAARYRRASQLVAVRRFRKDERHPAEQSFPRLAGVFDALRSRAAEAETIYSDFEPFVGAGLRLQEYSWSFPIELVPGRRSTDSGVPPEVIDLPALHQRISEGLLELTQGQLYPDDLLHKVSVRDRVFRGAVRWEDPQHPREPISEPHPQSGVLAVKTSWARLLDYGSHERIRHYLEARADLWKGQIVAEVFLRAYVQGNLFHVEGLPYLLPPVAERYRVVDGLLPVEPQVDGPIALWGALRSFALDVTTAVVEPFGVLQSMVRSRLRENWYSRMQRAQRAVDHGPKVSLRELASEPYYQNLFQEVDVFRFFASVQMRAITSVRNELVRAGYSVSEFDLMAQNVTHNNSFGGIQNNASGNAKQNLNGIQSTGAGSTMRQSKTG